MQNPSKANLQRQNENKIGIVKLKLLEGGMGIPIVCLLIEGGVHSLEHACDAIDRHLPLVVCLGTGRASDLLGKAVLHYRKLTQIGDEIVKNRQLVNLRTWIEDQLRRLISNNADKHKVTQLAETIKISLHENELVQNK